ncbi:MAG TPA: transketolase [Bacteroidales bacterium]|jgi:transketolase|nr:transketolase [Bacteroidales bacterium]MDD4235581.1 transketolase [Bacteroidales bacterium]HXK81947.1 transketolase [Bacteroidales bacterium]
MTNINKLQKIATQIRRDIVRMVHAQQSGHPGGALGCADFFTLLYFDVLKHNPQKFSMEGKEEDMFFLSNGHLSAVWYSVLARSGYFPIEELKTFRCIDSRLQGHPATDKKLPGIRIASGSLGQGLSAACGAALGKKMNKDKNLVYCLCGDGEIQEGQIWEAAMFAPAKRIDNLIAVIDCNDKQIDGSVSNVLNLGNIKAKWEAFGWMVIEANGNNMSQLSISLNMAKTLTGKGLPILILMKTEMGMGVDFMMGTHKWHGVAPNDEQLAQALSQLDETLGDF